MFKFKLLSLLVSFMMIFTSCISEPDDTPEHLLKSCFKAIKNNDWDSFAPLVVTSADILQKEMGIKVSKFKQKLTYTGGVLRPEQMKIMRGNFDRALSSSAHQIDFKNSKFSGIGTMLNSLTGELDTHLLYSIKIKSNGEVIDTKTLFPLFDIMEWEGKWRIFSLVFP